LIGSLVRCDDAEAAEHVTLLRTLCTDPAAFAQDRVADDELRARVLDALGEGSLAEMSLRPEAVAA
ncbi:MAG: hypothetical protein AAF907_09875, partial [Planctomycetota bacterium]